MKNLDIRVLCSALAGVILGTITFTCAAPQNLPKMESVAPPRSDTVYTSTRQINRLTVAPDGTLWVGTSGGVLHFSRGGSWHKWTRSDGLPSHEVRTIDVSNDVVSAVTPRGNALWRDGKWTAVGLAAAENLSGRIRPVENAIATAVWRGDKFTANADVLKIGEGKAHRSVPPPPS